MYTSIIVFLFTEIYSFSSNEFSFEITGLADRVSKHTIKYMKPYTDTYFRFLFISNARS